jgi:hypothetical protein
VKNEPINKTLVNEADGKPITLFRLIAVLLWDIQCFVEYSPHQPEREEYSKNNVSPTKALLWV